jgi:hypothetical protein
MSGCHPLWYVTPIHPPGRKAAWTISRRFVCRKSAGARAVTKPKRFGYGARRTSLRRGGGGCEADEDCKRGVCISGSCWECRTDSDCADVNGKCSSGICWKCSTGDDCASGVCSGGRCWNPPDIDAFPLGANLQLGWRSSGFGGNTSRSPRYPSVYSQQFRVQPTSIRGRTLARRVPWRH